MPFSRRAIGWASRAPPAPSAAQRMVTGALAAPKLGTATSAGAVKAALKPAPSAVQSAATEAPERLIARTGMRASPAAFAAASGVRSARTSGRAGPSGGVGAQAASPSSAAIAALRIAVSNLMRRREECADGRIVPRRLRRRGAGSRRGRRARRRRRPGRCRAGFRAATARRRRGWRRAPARR